jgi:heat shock protein Hsp15
VVVLALSIQRLSAVQAQLLYRETAESIVKRERNAEARRLNTLYSPHPDSKPDKNNGAILCASNKVNNADALFRITYRECLK